MRINGRTLRASDLRERRLLLSLGVDPRLGLRVPRTENPFMVARRLRRLAHGQSEDLAFLRGLASRTRRFEPRPSPELDVPIPVEAPDGVAAA